MEPEKKSLSFILLLLCSVLALLITFQWLILNDLYDVRSAHIAKLFLKPRMARLAYVMLMILLAFLFPRRGKAKDERIKWPFLASTLILALALVAGFSTSTFYNWLIFPTVFLLYTILVIPTVSSFKKDPVISDQTVFGLSHEPSRFYFSFQTAQGTFSIHKPQQNIYIDGGPGSGKSETFIKSMIYQCAERNYAGFVYDWEGDPTQPGCPILSRVAYGSIEHFRHQGGKLRFGFINFTDMAKTARVNVLSEKYVPKGSESLFIRNIAVTLMKNLEPLWKEKTDFWANNAINYVYSVAYKCYKERAKGINTLPHVIAFCLSDSNLVFEWLASDTEIALNMSSMLTSWKLGADQQTAGVISSAQTPLVLLNNKYIFWVLSPLPEEEFSLDITNPQAPTLLCIGNAPSIKEAVSPPISCIASVLMSQMNHPGKVPSVFLVDEFPTINLQGIDTFIGTARKHQVATILALQDFNQAVRDYGEKSANIIKSACGTQAFGMSGNDKTAREVENLLGEVKEIQESVSRQDSGGGSRTESLQREKVIKARDIAGQTAGHFIGKTANGKPPFFYTQFEPGKYKEKEIPAFSFPVDTGEVDMNREILDKIVEQNYLAIIDQVNETLLKEKTK